MKVEDLLRQAIGETGVNLQRSADEVIRYTAQQGAVLSLAAGEPGFGKAMTAATNAVALYAGLNATLEAEAADARLVGIITGVLFNMATPS
jgi:hypothetical protein